MGEHTDTTQSLPSGIGSRDFAQSIVETIREPLLVLDADLRVDQATRAFYQTFQVSPQETEGQFLYHLGNGQWDIPRLRTLLEDILPQDSVVDDFEVAHEFPEIGRKVMLLNARRLREADRERILLAIEDVTERRRLEAERGEFETRFSTLIRNLRDHAVFTLDREGRVTSWNRAAEQVLGYREAEVLGAPFAFIFTPQERQQGVPEAELRAAREQGRAEDERWHLRKGGEPFWALGILSAVQDAAGQPTGYVKILRDRTGSKRKDEALRESEKRFRGLIQASSQVLYVMSPDLSEMRRLWGRGFVVDTKGPTRNWLERYIPVDDQQKVREASAEAIRTRGVFELEHRVLRLDGSIGWASTRAIPILDDAGEITEWFGMGSDITERKKAVQALVDSQSGFREEADALARLNAASSRLWRALDLEHGLREMLDATLELLHADGGLIQVLRGERLHIVVHRGFQSQDMGDVQEVSLSADMTCTRSLHGRRHVITEDTETAAPRAPAHALARAAGYRALLSTPVCSPSGAPLGVITATFRAPHRPSEQALSRLDLYVRQAGDFIARKQAEDALQASQQQLRSLASELNQAEQRERKRLAKIVHDHIQQLIVAANIQAGVLKRERAPEPPRVVAERLDEILNEALDASRSLSVELSPPVLDETGLVGALHWLGARLQKQQHFRLHLRADPAAEPASADLRFMLFEAVRELLLNAAKYAGVEEAEVVLRRPSETQIEVLVRDQGQGFDPAQIQARPLDETGFGLFSIRERLAYLGGRMAIESAPGRGTQVTLRLEAPASTPAADEPPAEAGEDRPATVRFRRCPELCRVLIVDDHPVMREGLLRLFDFEPDIEVVGQAGDGQQAIGAAKELAPDVVLMDVNLGECMGGIEATRRILATQPEIAVIGLSMHADRSVEEAMLLAGASAYLTKGSELDALIGLIRRCAASGE